MYILFLLILTLIIFKTLFNSFGFNITPDKEKDIRNFIDKISSNQSSNQSNKNQQNNENIINSSIDNKKSNLSDIYDRYIKKINYKNQEKDETSNNEFDRELFLKLSERAIISILSYFSEENLELLKILLTPKMYGIFEKQINSNKEKNVKYKTVVVSVKNKELAEINDSNTYAKIKIVMEQINYIENNDGNLVSGSKDKIQNISETWVFIKDSESPIWLLDFIE